MMRGYFDGRPLAWWHYVFVAIGALGTAVIATVTVIDRPSGNGGNGGDPIGPGSSTLPPTSGVGLLFGRDITPLSTEPCRTATFAEGAAWQLGDARMRGEAVAPSYYCNMFATGTGSLDFNLGSAYRRLTATIGFSEDSPSTQHRVKFEVIGEHRTYLTDPLVLEFGESRRLVVDVTNVSRLTLKVVEVGQLRGVDAPSRPAWIRPAVTP